MRHRLLTLRPTVLALAFGMLLAFPALAGAQSGPGPTITMEPASAAPGTAVEIIGRDFPTEMTVDLRLSTGVGAFDLATAATARDGTFSQLVVLPALPDDGAWTVEAQAADGTVAGYAFEAAAPEVAPVEVPAAAVDQPVLAAATARDNAASDAVFLVILGCLLGVVSNGVLFTWRQLQDDRVQPGMGQGDDVIWNDGTADGVAEPTATSEPFWKAAPVEIAGPGEQEAPASA